MSPFVSIIISVRNGENTIKKCLDSVLNLRYRNYEIIAIDDGSTDNTSKMLADYPEIRTLTTPGVGPSQARNLAVNQAKGEFVAFIDADCLADKDWLEELEGGFQRFPNAVSCGGSQRLPFDATNFEKKVFFFMKKISFISEYLQRLNINENRIREVDHNPSCNVMYRKDVFLKEGSFLKGLWPGEDVELDYRLRKKGYKLVFNPEAIVYHYRPKDLNSFLRMMYRYGCSHGILMRKYNIFRKILFLPLFSIILLFILIFNFSLILLGGLFILTLVFFNFNIFLFFLGISGFIIWNMGFYKGIIFYKDFDNYGKTS